MAKTELRFEFSKPRIPSWKSANQLAQGHYGRELGDYLRDDELPHLLETVTPLKSWVDPNNAQRRSRHANPRVTAAYHRETGRLVGYAYSMDDASSGRTGALGTIEEVAKLKIPAKALLASRFMNFREVIVDPYYNRPEVVNILGAISTSPELNDHADQRRVSIYPWDVEGELLETVEAWGMEQVGETERVTVYPGGPTVPQYTYRADSIAELHENIMRLDGVAEVAERAVVEILHSQA